MAICPNTDEECDTFDVCKMLFCARRPPMRRAAIKNTGEWRPISTAPKDGTVILCFAPDSDAQQRWLIMWTEWEDGSGNWTDAHTLDSFDVEPTHWMPLPDRPIQPSEAA